MRAIDVRVGHDDNLVVAQIIEVEFGAHADTKRFAEIVDLCIGVELVGGGTQDVEDFAF